MAEDEAAPSYYCYSYNSKLHQRAATQFPVVLGEEAPDYSVTLGKVLQAIERNRQASFLIIT